MLLTVAVTTPAQHTTTTALAAAAAHAVTEATSSVGGVDAVWMQRMACSCQPVVAARHVRTAVSPHLRKCSWSAQGRSVAEIDSRPHVNELPGCPGTYHRIKEKNHVKEKVSQDHVNVPRVVCVPY